MNIQMMAKLMAALAMALMATGCSSDDLDEAGTTVPALELSVLDEAYYINRGDSLQPLWLRQLFKATPYLKVYRSERSRQYLVMQPLSGQTTTYDLEGGQPTAVSADGLNAVVESGKPWTCTHVYSFPLYPGDEEWNFQTHTVVDIKQMLLMPADLLGQMLTPDLLEVCLDYPYFIDFTFYDEMQNGFEYMCQEFNGYDELLQRKDAPEELLKKFYTHWQKLEAVKLLPPVEKGRYSLQCMLFNMIMAQDRILHRLSNEQFKLFLNLTIQHSQLEQSDPDMFGGIDRLATLYLYARIIRLKGGFQFASDDEKSRFEYFAETCTGDPAVLQIFTDDMAARMEAYLKSLAKQ